MTPPTREQLEEAREVARENLATVLAQAAADLRPLADEIESLALAAHSAVATYLNSRPCLDRWSGTSNTTICEAFNVAKRAGIDPGTLRAIEAAWLLLADFYFTNRSIRPYPFRAAKRHGFAWMGEREPTRAEAAEFAAHLRRLVNQFAPPTPAPLVESPPARTRRPAGDPPEAVPIPQELADPDFLAAWASWLADRRERRKPLTARAASMQLRQLAAVGPVAAVAASETSIASGWTGIFPSRAGARPAA